MAQFMSKALRMASACFLHHSAPSLCYSLYTEMTGDGLVLEGLSRPLRSAPAGCNLVLVFFVWRCFLFKVISPLRRSRIPPSALHPLYSTACLLACAQTDYSCPGMSEHRAARFQEYSLFLGNLGKMTEII